jgi:hypothetical protein
MSHVFLLRCTVAVKERAYFLLGLHDSCCYVILYILAVNIAVLTCLPVCVGLVGSCGSPASVAT